jgi:hypothetical protein
MTIQLKQFRAQDNKPASQLYNDIFGSILPRPMDLMDQEPLVYGPDNFKYCCMAFDGSKVVGHAAARAATVQMPGAKLVWAGFGNVYTHEAYRGHGLASKMNQWVWDRLRKDGVDGAYISGNHGIYTRFGAAETGSYTVYHFKTNQLPHGKANLKVRQAGNKDAALLAALHNVESVGYQREVSEFKEVLDKGWAYLLKARAWVIEAGRKPLAYLTMGRWEEGGKLAQAGVVEYAGSRPVLVAALRLILEREKIKEAELLVGDWDLELKWLLESHGLKGQWSSVPGGQFVKDPDDESGTHLILEPFRMFKKLRPYFESRLGTEVGGKLELKKGKGQALILSLGRESHEVPDLGRLARLVMGEKPSVWKARLPKSKALRSALQTVFPLPFPPIGLNWM